MAVAPNLLYLKSDVTYETERLPSGLKRLVVEVGPGNVIRVAERHFSASTFSAENVEVRAIVEDVQDEGGDYTRLRFVPNVGEPFTRPPLGDALCLVDIDPETRLEVRVAHGGRYAVDDDQIISATVIDMAADVEIELGASVNLQRGGTVRVVRKLGDKEPLATFTSAKSGSQLVIEPAETAGVDPGSLGINVWGAVDVPPVLSDHGAFHLEGLKILTSGVSLDPAVFVLLGASGAGKTTVANHATRRLHEMGRPVVRFTEFPILLEMARSEDQQLRSGMMQPGARRFRLHDDGEGFEMLDPSAYQDALREIIRQMGEAYRSSVVTPVFILELAPDGFYEETLTVPQDILDAAHVMHVEVDSDICVDRMLSRAALAGADNHGFDANVWRTLFDHDNQAFILQLAQARQANGPFVCTFYNYDGADLISAARQLVEYGCAISTAEGFRRLLGTSDRLLTLPARHAVEVAPPSSAPTLSVTNRGRWPSLLDKVRDTRLLKHPEVRVYESANIAYETLNPANVNFSTFYLMKSQLMELCRTYRTLYEMGYDPFNLNGHISYERDGQTFNLSPIIVERTRETVVGHGGATTTAESLTAADGAHTLYLARLLQRRNPSFRPGMVIVSGVDIPFYAIPCAGDFVIPGDMVPEVKKLLRVDPAEASEDYRDFGPFRSTGRRTVGEVAESDFDVAFEREFELLVQAQERFLSTDPTPLARTLIAAAPAL